LPPHIAGGSWAKAYQQAEEAAKFDPALGHLITSDLKRGEKNNAAAVSELRLAAQDAAGSALVLFRVGSALLDPGYADEAHSYLVTTEHRILQTIFQFPITSIIVSHRPAALRYVDRVIEVLDAPKCVSIPAGAG